MRHVVGLILVSVMSALLMPLALAEERITEEYVVDMLAGKQQRVVTEAPAGFAFRVLFPAQGEREPKGDTKGNSVEDWQREALYPKLIPLGRALESQALQAYRFVIVVHPDSPTAAGNAAGLGQKLAAIIRDFLTIHFAIEHQRLSINVAESPSPFDASSETLQAPPRWRVAVFRQR